MSFLVPDCRRIYFYKKPIPGKKMNRDEVIYNLLNLIILIQMLKMITTVR